MSGVCGGGGLVGAFAGVVAVYIVREGAGNEASRVAGDATVVGRVCGGGRGKAEVLGQHEAHLAERDVAAAVLLMRGQRDCS